MIAEAAQAQRRADALHAAAARLAAVGTAIADTGVAVRRVAADELPGDAWLGAAALAAHRAHAAQATGLDQMSAAVHRMATVIGRLGYAAAETGWREAALAADWPPNGPAASSRPNGPVLTTPDPSSLLAEAGAAERAENAATAAVLLAVAADLSRLAAGWGAAALVDPVQGVLLSRAGALGAAPDSAGAAADRLNALVRAGDPVAIRSYAQSLSPAVRDRLAADWPELVGPVDGMPPRMRYAANRVLLARGLADAESRADAATAARIETWLSEPGRQFLLVDLPGGRIAEVLGNLDTATHVGVMVPGIGNTLANFDDHSPDAQNLWRQADELSPGGVAMISWLGYRTPGFRDAILEDRAVAAAGRLRDLIAGLVLRSGVTTTVVAHSYGTLVAGLELARGLRVAAIAVLGSPGMGADTAAALHLPIGTRLYAARAPGDFVGWSENFNRDPTDPRFGAIRMATERPGEEGPHLHTSYFSGESECTRNLARVLTGRYSQVTVTDPILGHRVEDAVQLLLGGPLDKWVITPGLSWLVRHQPTFGNELLLRVKRAEDRSLSPDLRADVIDDVAAVTEEEWSELQRPTPAWPPPRWPR